MAETPNPIHQLTHRKDAKVERFRNLKWKYDIGKRTETSEQKRSTLCLKVEPRKYPVRAESVSEGVELVREKSLEVGEANRADVLDSRSELRALHSSGSNERRATDRLLQRPALDCRRRLAASRLRFCRLFWIRSHLFE